MAEPTAAKPAEQTSIKETLISITIAFAMAFVFRAFVIEAYVIPTGSMAPTLMGQHMRFQSPETGYQWAVNPWQMQSPREAQIAEPLQRRVTVHDPMSGFTIADVDMPRRAGDRILVLKYLRHFFDPSRFDVVVFKCPYDPQTNFIKRLIGLPGEQVALVDGDVFTRTPKPSDPTGPDVDTWSLDGWTIDRKTERVQREVWQPIFDSAWTPNKESRNERAWFTSPWTGGQDAQWKIKDRRSYRHDGAAPARLDWDARAIPIAAQGRHPLSEVNDNYPYNETPFDDARLRYPVADLRLSCGLEPDVAGMAVAAIVQARRHEFRASISGVTASLQIRPADGPEAEWTTLTTGTLSAPIPAGKVTNIEFWHVDQSLRLWVDGALVASAEYDWTPAERVRAAMGMSLDEALHRDPSGSNIFADARLYAKAEPRWEFSGGSFTVHRVALARDLHYRAAEYQQPSGNAYRDRGGTPAQATHPYSTPTLTDSQFFVCGDNSPASLDARLWDRPDPFVAAAIDGTEGVVPQALMLGKAFFVYFPSTTSVFGYRVLPDFGRLRWIW